LEQGPDGAWKTVSIRPTFVEAGDALGAAVGESWRGADAVPSDRELSLYDCGEGQCDTTAPRDIVRALKGRFGSKVSSDGLRIIRGGSGKASLVFMTNFGDSQHVAGLVLLKPARESAGDVVLRPAAPPNAPGAAREYGLGRVGDLVLISDVGTSSAPTVVDLSADRVVFNAPQGRFAIWVPAGWAR
jgi:hypothetical protein